ncbi:arginine decarboxylase, partial [candidate division KSB1 bacterium]|nr:arginine decarboxylase [candidate division KSB1 bacterium]
MKREGIKKRQNGVIQKWTIKDSLELYNIDKWGLGYYNVNEKGHLTISPSLNPNNALDLKEFVDEMVLRGVQPPLLIRFTDVLKKRIEDLNEAFIQAIKEYEYKNRYTGVYPIKVNQHRDIVEDILNFGIPYDFGIEAGSKPELLVALAVHTNPDSLIV